MNSSTAINMLKDLTVRAEAVKAEYLTTNQGHCHTMAEYFERETMRIAKPHMDNGLVMLVSRTNIKLSDELAAA